MFLAKVTLLTFLHSTYPVVRSCMEGVSWNFYLRNVCPFMKCSKFCTSAFDTSCRHEKQVYVLVLPIYNSEHFSEYEFHGREEAAIS